MSKYVVGVDGEIPPGGRKIVEVGGHSIGVFNVGGDFVALLNRCPHQAGPLCDGVLWSALESTVPGEYRTSRQGEILTCPWHGWEFELRTGQSWCDPSRLRVRAYDVQVVSGTAILDADEAPIPGMVKGPYVAQTYPVTTEGLYLVVDIGPRARD